MNAASSWKARSELKKASKRNSREQPSDRAQGDSLGCGCLYIGAALLLTILFPSTRDWTITKPVLALWRRFLSGEPPRWPLVDALVMLLVYALPLVGVGIVVTSAGLLARMIAVRISKSSVPAPAWSAAIAAVSLLAMLLVAILK